MLQLGMSIFGPKVEQSACLAATFATVVQIANQVAGQGYMAEPVINFLGPVIFSSCHRCLDDRQAVSSLVATFNREKVSCTAISGSMESWIADARNLSSSNFSPSRKAELAELWESLTAIEKKSVAPALRRGMSVDQLMDGAYPEIFKVFEVYFQNLAKTYPDFMDIFVAATQILSSSYVLFLADLFRSKNSPSAIVLRVRTAVAVHATICVLIGQTIDEMKP